MPKTVLFRDRSREAQILLGGVVPAVVGAIAGILLGVTTTGYWVIAIVAAVGGFLAGFEHLDGWGGADRGLAGGLIYGVSLLVAHAIAGTHAKVSLGSFPPFLAVLTAIGGMFLSAAGGRAARAIREREERRAEQAAHPPETPAIAPSAPAIELGTVEQAHTE